MRALLLLASLMIAVPDREDPAPKRAKSLEEQLVGQWVVVKQVISGKEAPDRAGGSYIFARDTVQRVEAKGEIKDPPLKYRLDASKTPVAMDIVSVRGENFDIMAIVKLEGDVLTICYSLSDTRPLEFISPKTANAGLMQLRRLGKK